MQQNVHGHGLGLRVSRFQVFDSFPFYHQQSQHKTLNQVFYETLHLDSINKGAINIKFDFNFIFFLILIFSQHQRLQMPPFSLRAYKGFDILPFNP